MKTKIAKISSFSFALILILSVFAFGYVLSTEIGVVSAYNIKTISLSDGKILVYDMENLDGGYSIRENMRDTSFKTLLFEGSDTPQTIAATYNANLQSSSSSASAPAPIPLPVTLTNSEIAELTNLEVDSTIDPYEGTSLEDYGGSSAGTPASKPSAQDSTGRGKVDGWIFKDKNALPFAAGHIAQGLEWSLAAYTAVQAFGTMLGADKEEQNAISISLAGGIMAGKLAYSLLGKGGAGGFLKEGGIAGNIGTSGRFLPGESTWGSVLSSPWTSGLIGAGVAWWIYTDQSKKTKTAELSVDFTCLPWQAPRGGADCELCNDGTLPCSEYRCKSLGQSCALINKGTQFESCVNQNPRDVAPPVIKPLDAELTSTLQYFDVKEMPPGAGFKIKSTETATGCIPPFKPFQFGIQTNEPAQCKIDIAPKGNYSKMGAYFGGNNLYSYNHTEYLSLPSTEDLKNSSLKIENGKELSFFVRCIDSLGNANEADYKVELCVDPSPDTTAPVIQGTSISQGSCVSSVSDNSTVEFYLNEPAECKWSFNDMDYDRMAYNMTCATTYSEINALQIYPCTTTLTGIAKDGTDFYVRCKDQPAGVNESKRNENSQSYKFNLKGSNPLKMSNLKPDENVYGAVRPAPVELYVETLFGCENNKAICYYSTTGQDNSYIAFFDTDNEDGINTQRLDLQAGQHNYYVKCVDSGGNVAQNVTSFTVEIDTDSPIITRVYQEDEYLKILTQRNSECVFTNTGCDFLFPEGTIMPYANSTSHITQWFTEKTYYIKCKDEYRSEPTSCSIVVRPTDNFL